MPNYYLTSFAIAPKSAIEEDIRAGGVKDERIIAHTLRVDPGDFRPWELLPLPCAVAAMAEALQPDADSAVLEIGTGTGYMAAVLAVMSKHVVTIELSPRVARIAERSFQQLPYGHKVKVIQGDGRAGCPAYAPYDRICVSGSLPEVARKLKEQLADRGRLLIPVGPAKRQELHVITRVGDSFETRTVSEVEFQPLANPAA